MNESDEVTTIQIKKATRGALKRMGVKGETYDEIIQRLLAEYCQG
jgi:hypothetical protein